MSGYIDYEFEPLSWPPPKSREVKGTYLFGFDSNYQPYIVRWDMDLADWVAVTLGTNRREECIPEAYDGRGVDKIISYWSDTPMLKQNMRRKYIYGGDYWND